MSEEFETDTDVPIPTPEKRNPFLDKLVDNQRAQARAALMSAIVDNPKQSVGEIYAALESQNAGDFIMLELFKEVTIEDLVKAAVACGTSVSEQSSPKPVTRASVKNDEEDEEEDELDDDDEFDDEDELDDDGEEEEEEEPPKKSKRKAKKNKKNKKKAKGKSESSGMTDREYDKAFLSCLRSNKARDEDSAMTSEQIRKEIGGGSDELRASALRLRENEKIDTAGKARGTKYFLD